MTRPISAGAAFTMDLVPGTVITVPVGPAVAPEAQDLVEVDIMYLTGVTNPNVEAAAAMRPGLGLLATPASGAAKRTGHYVAWGADNGCFAEHKTGRPFDADAWLAWLAARPDVDRCLFAALPDRVGDAVATLKRSSQYVDQVLDLGYRPALVAQEGLEDLVDEVPWSTIGCLFIGGEFDEWKLGPAAAELVAEANQRGVWTHMGRVNSWKRITYAASIGCDSADGTFLARAPTVNLPRMLSWIDRIAAGEHLRGPA